MEIVIEEIVDPEPAGRVLSATPEKGEILTTGDTVTLVVSLGPELATMPNVVGLDVEKAINLLITSGFKSPDIEPVPSEKPINTVVFQSVEKNTQADVNSTIVLQVSTGPEDTKPAMITKDVVINLRGSAADMPCSVKVLRNNQVIFDETVAQGTTPITLKNQTGLGAVYYDVVIDEQDGWFEKVSFNANG